MALYSDINQKTPFTSQHQLDEDAVQQSLHNLLRTRKGERLFHPEYGVDLEHLLFELMSDEVAVVLEVQLKQDINRWEPRIKVLDITVEEDPDNNTYRMRLLYQIKGLEGRNFEYADNLQAASGAD